MPICAPLWMRPCSEGTDISASSSLWSVYIQGMPDTRESGGGRSQPPVPTSARQLVALLSNAFIRLRSVGVLAAISIALVACVTSSPENAPAPVTFPPASEEEMARFCTRHEAVKNLSFSEMAAALIDYAPDFVKAELIIESENRPPGPPTLSSHLINEFISRCPPVADPP